MADLADLILGRYLGTYRNLIEAQAVEKDSVTLSFPFHYSGQHRIELTITQVTATQFLISDMARTIGELRDFGLGIGTKMRDRLEGITKTAGLKIVQDHLVLESSAEELGNNVQRSLEAVKTVADVYLVHRVRMPTDQDLVRQVREILNKKRLLYREKERINGQLETHAVDFLLPKNGKPALAIAVLPGHSSHLIAEAWGFKCDDMRVAHSELKIGLVYDTKAGIWAGESKHILETKADIAVGSDALPVFEQRLPS